MKRLVAFSLLFAYGAIAFVNYGLHGLPGFEHHHHHHGGLAALDECATPPSTGCSHGAHEHHEHSEGLSGDEGPHDTPHTPHTEDDCLVCQFLAQAAASPTAPAAEYAGQVVELVPHEAPQTVCSTVSLLPLSRAPPVA